MPFSSLPEELFVAILSSTGDPMQQKSAYWTQLRTARLVCKRWNEVITQASPSLWAFISTEWMSQKWIEQNLRYSQSCDLTLSVSTQKKEIWDILLPHAARWASLELKEWRSIPFREAFRPAETLRLQNLVLCGCEEITGTLGGNLPELRSLELHGVALPWMPSDFPSAALQHLTINGNPSNYRYETDQILECLRSCQKLNTLRLREFQSDPPSSPLRPVSLPNLTQLVLSKLESHLTCTILRLTYLPACRSLVIQQNGAGQEACFAALSHAAEANKWGRVEHIGLIEIWCNGDLKVIGSLVSEGAIEYLQFSLTCSDPSSEATKHLAETFGEMCENIIGAEVGWTLRLYGLKPFKLSRILPACARVFPTTERLMIGGIGSIPWLLGRRPKAPDPLQCLYRDSSLSADTGEVVKNRVGLAFPQLRQLDMEYSNRFADDIIQLVHRRILGENSGGDLQINIVGRGASIREDVVALEQLTSNFRIRDESWYRHLTFHLLFKNYYQGSE